MRRPGFRFATLVFLIGSAALAACSDGSTTDPTGTATKNQTSNSGDTSHTGGGSDSLPPNGPGPVVTVHVFPAQGVVWVGARVAFFAVGANARGQSVANRPVTWRSSDDKIATIDNTGSARAIA